MAASSRLPSSGTVFISVTPYDRGAAVKIARDLLQLGFQLVATVGTGEYLRSVGLETGIINKVSDGSPHIVDAIRSGKIDLIINTPRGGQAHYDGTLIRGTAHLYNVPIITTMSAAQAAVQGMRALRQKPLRVRSLQAHHAHSR